MSTKFTTTHVTPALNTKIPAETAGNQKGYLNLKDIRETISVAYDLGEYPNINGSGLVIDTANGPIQKVSLTGGNPSNVTISITGGQVEGSSLTLYVSSATASTEIDLAGISVPFDATLPVILPAFNASYIIEFRGIGYLWTMTEIKGPFQVD